MRAKKPRYRLWPLILALAVVAGGSIGAAWGKYIRTATFTGTLSLKAELAESITLQESPAVRQLDGSYKLDKNAAPDAGNAYTLIPGLDIPKDPYVTVTEKTSIDAYLFIEVVDNTPNEAIAYKVSEEHWLDLGITGKNGGDVYVYTADKSTPAVVDENISPIEEKTVDGVLKKLFMVPILEDDTVTVGQKLISAGAGETDLLKFYACMGETASSDKENPIEKAIEVYRKLNAMT